MIVLEGPDGGGKSTLADLISKKFDMVLKPSEGPEQHPGEINERIARYHREWGNNNEVIFDRHPCVSQIAYGLVHHQSKPDDLLVAQFYDLKPLLIYCRPDPRSVTHTASGAIWDTAEYLEKVDKNYNKLMRWYDEWAVWNANLIYRIGEDPALVMQSIKLWREK